VPLGTAAVVFLRRRTEDFRPVTRRFFGDFPALRIREDMDLDRACLDPLLPEDSFASRSRCSPKSSIRMHPERGPFQSQLSG
jgi:hypothetical protein